MDGLYDVKHSDNDQTGHFINDNNETAEKSITQLYCDSQKVATLFLTLTLAFVERFLRFL